MTLVSKTARQTDRSRSHGAGTGGATSPHKVPFCRGVRIPYGPFFLPSLCGDRMVRRATPATRAVQTHVVHTSVHTNLLIASQVLRERALDRVVLFWRFSMEPESPSFPNGSGVPLQPSPLSPARGNSTSIRA